MDIKKILALPEGKTLEFKRDLSSMKPILKTIVAFANTAGGTLIIGRENEGAIVGVDDVFKAEEKLSNAISDAIFPKLIPEIEITMVEASSLLVVTVPHWQGPFYIKSDGEENGVYIRLGSTNRVAGPEIISELKRVSARLSFDQMPVIGVGIEGLDRAKIKEAFESFGKAIGEGHLETLGILVSHNGKKVVSHGGMILFGKKEFREKYFPNAQVRAARFQGTEKVQFIDQLEVEGTLLDAMNEVPKFIQRNTRLAAKIETLRREDVPEYSPVVIREVLTNALVHADYALSGMNPKIAIFSDRMEIDSPGMLPFGFVFEDFISGVSHVRNKVIARVFRELNLMEEWGTGYRRIVEACQKGGYKIPKWEEVGPSVRVTLYPHSLTIPEEEGKLTERQQKICKILAKTKTMPAKSIHALLKEEISDRTLRNELILLKNRGIVTTEGKGPKTLWRLST